MDKRGGHSVRYFDTCCIIMPITGHCRLVRMAVTLEVRTAPVQTPIDPRKMGLLARQCARGDITYDLALRRLSHRNIDERVEAS
jgi:hypothetical protein